MSKPVQYDDAAVSKLPRKVKREFMNALNTRLTAKNHKTEYERLKDEADSTLLPLMTAFSIGKYKAEGVGVVSIRTNSGSTIKKDKLIQELALAGLPADTITNVIDKATESWSKQYVDFRL